MTSFVGQLDGLKLSWVSASQVQIASGAARGSSDQRQIVVSAALTVDITVSGAGGLDTGSEAANTWYSVWVISQIGGGARGLLSASATAPLLPDAYVSKRRLGWVRNDGSSNFLHFNARGDGRTRQFYYDEARSVINILTGGSATAFTDVDLSTLVPPNCNLAYLMTGLIVPAVTGNNTDVLDIRPNGANSSDGPFTFGPGNTIGSELEGGVVWMPTDANRIIEYRVSDADDDADIWVLGFQDEL